MKNIIDRAARNETIEVQFADEATAKKYSSMNIKNGKWWCFPMYLEREWLKLELAQIILTLRWSG